MRWVTECLAGEGALWPPRALGGPPHPLDFTPLLWWACGRLGVGTDP